MKYVRVAEFKEQILGACGVLFLLVVGCQTAMPTKTKTPREVTLPVPTSSPMPRPPRPTPAPCCVIRDFPPVCNIVPGESTVEDVERVLGAPDPILITTVIPEDVDLLLGTRVDTRWGYGYECPVGVDFDDGLVSVVYYPLKTEKQLDHIVSMYGPPGKVQLIWFHLSDEEPGGYWLAVFLWPDRGLAMDAILPQAVEQPDQAPPFRADLRVGAVWYFQPAAVEEIVNTYYEGKVLIDWPGMTE
jgi:hypothetical protein